MMSKSPFGEDVMTIIMGIDPSDPGMHGPLEKPCPTDDAVELVTKIRDMCENFLRSAGKGDGDGSPDEEPKPEPDAPADGEE